MSERIRGVLRNALYILLVLVGGVACGNGVGRINEVTLRRARLVLEWVTCPGSTPGGGTVLISVCNQPTKANSAFHPFGVDKLSSEQVYR